MSNSESTARYDVTMMYCLYCYDVIQQAAWSQLLLQAAPTPTNYTFPPQHCGHRKPQRTILESYDTSIIVNREFLASTFGVMIRVS